MHATKRAFRGATAMSGIYAGPAPKPKDGDDPTTLIAKIQESFEDFKAANDERMDLFDKRFDDVVQNEKVERINANITDLQTALDDALKKLNRITVGGGANDNDAALRVHAAKIFSISSKERVRPEDVDVETYRNYRNAFEEYIRCEARLERLPADLRAAMEVGSDPAGGFLVPDEMSMEIERRIFETSPMRQIARVITIGGNAWEAPFKSTDATSGGWVGEKQARPSTDTPKVGMQRIEVAEQYAFPR